MKLQLVALAGVKLDKEVYEVILPTSEGEIAVFPDHEPLVTLAVPGAIAVRETKDAPDSDLEYYAISGGIVEISGRKVRVLVDEADSSDDIAEEESRAALERATELRDNTKDQVEREKAMELIDRHSVRLKVAELRRRHRR